MNVNLAYRSSTVASFPLKALHLSHCSEKRLLFWVQWWHWDLCKKYWSYFCYLKCAQKEEDGEHLVTQTISYVIPLCSVTMYRVWVTNGFGVWFYLFEQSKNTILWAASLHSPFSSAASVLATERCSCQQLSWKNLHKRWLGLTGALSDKSWELPFVRTCGHCVIHRKPPTTAILMLHNFCHKPSITPWLNLLWLITHSKNRGSVSSCILSTPSIGTLMPEPLDLLTWATWVTQSLHSLRLSTSVSSLLSSGIAES